MQFRKAVAFAVVVTLLFSTVGCKGVKKVIEKIFHPGSKQNTPELPFKKVEIPKIQIDTISGLEDGSGGAFSKVEIKGAVVIDLDNLPKEKINGKKVKGYTQDNTGTVRIESLIHLKKLKTKSNRTVERVSPNPPSQINELVLDSLIIIHKGKETLFLNYPIRQWIGIGHSVYEITGKSETVQVSDSLLYEISDLESRLNALQKKIDGILLLQPAHAVKMFYHVIDTIRMDLSEIRQQVNYLKTRYLETFNKNALRFKQIKSKLYSRELTVEDMEVEAASASRSPNANIIAVRIQYGPGDSEITDRKQQKALGEALKMVMQKKRSLQNDRPTRVVKPQICLTGYADKLVISGSLETEMRNYGKDKGENCNASTDQQALNCWLSFKRAEKAQEALSGKLKAEKVNECEYLAQGFGQVAPKFKGISQTCQDDCPDWRVVLISVVAYSDEIY